MNNSRFSLCFLLFFGSAIEVSDAVLRFIMEELLNLDFEDVPSCTWDSTLARQGKKLADSTINLEVVLPILV